MVNKKSKIIEFRVPFEIYERAKKEAENRGYKSAGLFTKQLLFSCLETEQKDNLSEDGLVQIRDEIDRVWEAIEVEQRQQRKFRERVDNTFVSLLENIKMLVQNKTANMRVGEGAIGEKTPSIPITNPRYRKRKL